MKTKTVILYDLKEKSNGERARIIQQLYGYRDKSNYNYSYERKGLLDGIKIERIGKTMLEIKDKKDLAKVMEILNQLKVKAEIAKIQ